MNQPEPPDELLLCLDEYANPIEPHVRSDVHEKPLRWWHATTGIWVVDKTGRLLCSKRSELLNQNPGKWQARFGGHVQFHQTYEQNAVSELLEEVGLEMTEADLHQIGDVAKNEEYKHFGKLYACLYEGNGNELTFPDGEITKAKWLTMDEYNKLTAVHPEEWTNGCGIEAQQAIKKWLKLL